MEISDFLKNISDAEKEFRSAMRDQLTSLRIANKNATKLSANSFSMSIRDLAPRMSLSAGMYDFTAQYDLMLSALEKSHPSVFVRKMQEMCKTGYLDGNPIHPDVLATVSPLFLGTEQDIEEER